WLRDFLPRDLPNTRIVTYGYDSARASVQLSVRAIRDHADDLINQLAKDRRNSESR
ncbi:hypothetical protein BU17DRAFT_58588, partial [Hysterangium stoloniferum]